mmetsp:Transcript_93793/g.291983  ORF Transcript_93793/g.291983 Transcript_93793/m.291983 type:complete len:231 (+) Transcript_93793:294-986(+)
MGHLRRKWSCSTLGAGSSLWSRSRGPRNSALQSRNTLTPCDGWQRGCTGALRRCLGGRSWRRTSPWRPSTSPTTRRARGAAMEICLASRTTPTGSSSLCSTPRSWSPRRRKSGKACPSPGWRFGSGGVGTRFPTSRARSSSIRARCWPAFPTGASPRRCTEWRTGARGSATLWCPSGGWTSGRGCRARTAAEKCPRESTTCCGTSSWRRRSKVAQALYWCTSSELLWVGE